MEKAEAEAKAKLLKCVRNIDVKIAVREEGNSVVVMLSDLVKINNLSAFIYSVKAQKKYLEETVLDSPIEHAIRDLLEIVTRGKNLRGDLKFHPAVIESLKTNLDEL